MQLTKEQTMIYTTLRKLKIAQHEIHVIWPTFCIIILRQCPLFYFVTWPMFWYLYVQYVLCCVFVFFSSCVPYVTSLSGLSICYCHFGALYFLFKQDDVHCFLSFVTWPISHVIIRRYLVWFCKIGCHCPLRFLVNISS